MGAIVTYKRFEDLPVWNAAIDLAEMAFALCEDKSLGFQGDLRSQLQRAALSVSNNVAEGFERGTTNELIHFLYIARGSAGEVRSMLAFMHRLPRFEHLKSQISDLKSCCESCSRQIRAWADHLQNTAVKGQRHLTDEARDAEEKERRRKAFLNQMRDIASKNGQANG